MRGIDYRIIRFDVDSIVVGQNKCHCTLMIALRWLELLMEYLLISILQHNSRIVRIWWSFKFVFAGFPTFMFQKYFLSSGENSGRIGMILPSRLLSLLQRMSEIRAFKNGFLVTTYRFLASSLKRLKPNFIEHWKGDIILNHVFLTNFSSSSIDKLWRDNSFIR